MTRHAAHAVAVLTLAATGAAADTNLGLDASNAYAAELRADASTRGFLNADPSEYAPKIFGYIQSRYYFSGSDGYTGTTEDTYTGFQNTRTRLGVKGNIHSRVSYEIEAQFSSSSGSFTLLDGFAKIDLTDDVAVQVGQFIPPFARSYLTSPSRLLDMERSATEVFFPGDRDQGIMLSAEGERLHASIMIGDGSGTLNTAYTSAAESDYAVSGRVEYLAAGDWSQFRDFTSFRGSDFGAMLGAGLYWMDGGNTGGTTDMNTLAFTADGALEFDGANLSAIFYWQSMDTTAGDYTDMGLVIQGGVFLTDIVEVFARYDTIFADSDRPLNDDFSSATLGLNYYLIPESHAAKLSFDFQYFFDDQASSPVPASTTIGVLGATDEQYTLRAQLQVMF